MAIKQALAVLLIYPPKTDTKYMCQKSKILSIYQQYPHSFPQHLYEPINKLDIVLWKNGESFLKVIHSILCINYILYTVSIFFSPKFSKLYHITLKLYTFYQHSVDNFQKTFPIFPQHNI